MSACFARLQWPYPQADLTTIAVYHDEAVQLATLLLTVVQAKNVEGRELVRWFRQHPDYRLFSSLPGTGDFLGPALLAHFGDDRQPFPSPASVQALAGTRPVTDASGKRRVIKFRKACDHHFRHVAQQWTRASLSKSAWAQAYWERVRPGCASDSHAYRCLANRWLAIAWKVWQTRHPYDEDYHLQQRCARSQPRA